MEALKDLGVAEVSCLVAIDDDTYTYNKRINHLPPIQEHRMIERAVERGVAEERIAAVLRLDVQSIRKRRRLLEGICADAATILPSCRMRHVRPRCSTSFVAWRPCARSRRPN